MRLNRRRALQLAGATALLSAAGGYALTRRPEDLVHSVLERHFGPLRMARADLVAFTEVSLARHRWIEPPWKLAAAFGAAYDAALEGPARRLLPEDSAAQLERFERHVLGDAVRLTDIAMRSDPEGGVSFLGPSACLNPYARFEEA
ncbi:hypothetical protein LAZ40_16870 [Cereibacter sphaeroides]|uniref:hypothetical protein n=1 Tax=Cereibacter sphaeroides TaxID=1063 RepID=UPI001F377529|nr:hypothetical protein [Cereibacter sphaeroides]MCE6960700.1 hypothetical protein [Cereibacter sphaeroides]MCE6970034.1 hypothetical protein [Cereibacter sphaeroides]MCE6973198.1 hypothetical protein [Cereibacter sphaeroides]